jgi:hypothetical protein
MRGRHVLLATGLLFIGLGFAGLVTHVSTAPPAGWAVWFTGAAVVHDALLAPLILGAAALAGRAPRPVRGPVRAALVLAGAVTFVAFPMVLGYGRRPDNPSVLPRAYGTDLAAIIILIGLVTAALTALKTRRVRVLFARWWSRIRGVARRSEQHR